jgi:hypothetical protein
MWGLRPFTNPVKLMLAMWGLRPFTNPVKLMLASLTDFIVRSLRSLTQKN